MTTIAVDAYNVVLPTGTTFGICMMEGEKATDVELFAMEKTRVAALFPKRNVDFGIKIDNTNSQRAIRLKLTINQQRYVYQISAGVKIKPIQALTTNGKKLHFLSQDIDEGNLLVAQTAAKYGLSYKEMAKMCCQIKCEVDIETPPEPMPCFFFTSRADAVQIFVRNLVGATLSYIVDLENTIAQLKSLIYIKEKIPPEDQRLLYIGKELYDPLRKLREYSISSNSTLHLLLSLKGGRQVPTDDVPENDVMNYSRGGTRGVICYGQKSTQKFGTFTRFQADETYEIKPFIIELRMISEYTPI